MKVILSRKGFDSGYGGQPSPILPDGTMLSMPIPTPGDKVTYAELSYNGVSYDQYIRMLNNHPMVGASDECHLDPDIRTDVIARPNGWHPAFGQIDAALTHLNNQGVGEGDIFLFFGWFRQTEMTKNGLKYIGPSSGFHAIYGYMQVGEIIKTVKDVPEWLRDHPHAMRAERWKHNNALFIGTDKLSLNPSLPGAGTLNYHPGLKLTKDGYSRSRWALPEFFKEIPISYNANAWHGDVFHSAAKGQEFVFTANDQAIEWIKGLIR